MNMEISTIIAERLSLEKNLAEITREYKKQKADLSARIALLKQKEQTVTEGYDLAKVELGRYLIVVSGNPYARTDDVRMGAETIAEHAIADILSGCKHLKGEYFGNKEYGRFYQRCDCEYHYGPTYGSIVDYIGLRDGSRIPTTPEEVEAAVYYIKLFESEKAAEIIRTLNK